VRPGQHTRLGSLAKRTHFSNLNIKQIQPRSYLDLLPQPPLSAHALFHLLPLILSAGIMDQFYAAPPVTR